MVEQLVIRNLPDGTKTRLVARARRGGRKPSAETEARGLITEVLANDTALLDHYFELAADYRSRYPDSELPQIEYANYQPRPIFEASVEP